MGGLDAGKLVTSNTGSSTLLVQHYGIVSADGQYVIHRMPAGILKDELLTGAWCCVGRGSISGATRAEQYVGKDWRGSYNLLGNNCEHFARYFAGNGAVSTQLFAVPGVGTVEQTKSWMHIIFGSQ
jgi:hypothetical protein